MLSYSKVKFLTGDNLVCRLDFFKNLSEPFKGSEATAKGSAIHAGIQGIISDQKCFTAQSLGFDNFRTKEAQLAKAQAELAGEICVSQSFDEDVKEATKHALGHQAVIKLFDIIGDDWVAEKHLINKRAGIHGYADICKKGYVVDIKTTAQFDKALKWQSSNEWLDQLSVYAELAGGAECYILVQEAVAPYRTGVIYYGYRDSMTPNIANAFDLAEKLLTEFKNAEDGVKHYQALVDKENEEKINAQNQTFKEIINFEELWAVI